MYVEALAELQKAVELSEQNTGALASLAHGYAVAGKRTEALDLLAQLNELAQRKYFPPYDLALIHAELGEPERAFEWLDKAYDERAEWMIYLAVDPRLDCLRHDPRFTDLLRRIGLAP
jgi:tetratricopeptide (TPR) repeat protein